MKNFYVNELKALRKRTFIRGFLWVGLGSAMAFFIMPLFFGSFTTYQDLTWVKYVVLTGLFFGLIAGIVSCLGLNKYIKRANAGAPIDKLRGLLTNIVNATDVTDNITTTIYIKLEDNTDLILQDSLVNKTAHVGDLVDVYVFLDKAPTLERLQKTSHCLVLSDSERYKYHDTWITKVN